jgi:hypothetical protein
MRSRFLIGWAALVVMLFLASLVLASPRGVVAAGNQPTGPDRFTEIVQRYTSYEWWLTNWSDNTVLCSIDVDHQGLPSAEDILDACGQDAYDQWIATDPCPSTDDCSGYYLQLAKSKPAQRKVGVQQPPPLVWVTLNGCVPFNSTFKCDSLPTLVLTGEEPLAGEYITNLSGNVDAKPFNCATPCQLDLGPTGEEGSNLEFWAFSSYGDSSQIFQARVRVTKSKDPSDPEWYTDVLSSQWQGNVLAGCSLIWDTFPPLGGAPDWLSTPQRPEELVTNVSYEYLSADLIKKGVVDATSCEDGGIFANGFANTCGLEAARPAVNDWQNRFDKQIFLASQQTGVPARLLKNIFARESQFWPGTAADHPEAGLGQMTDGGADVLLTWNPGFYEQFCPSVLNDVECKTKIYPKPEDGWEGIGLNNSERSLLRGALVNSVDSVCPGCSLGIDLKKTDYSVGVFAQTLVANCRQTGKVIDLNYGNGQMNLASYEDLWRFTLVNYNAGPGCLGLAVNETNISGEPLDWAHLSTHLTTACKGAINYVNEISNFSP